MGSLLPAPPSSLWNGGQVRHQEGAWAQRAPGTPTPSQGGSRGTRAPNGPGQGSECEENRNASDEATSPLPREGASCCRRVRGAQRGCRFLRRKVGGPVPRPCRSRRSLRVFLLHVPPGLRGPTRGNLPPLTASHPGSGPGLQADGRGPRGACTLAPPAPRRRGPAEGQSPCAPGPPRPSPPLPCPTLPAPPLRAGRARAHVTPRPGRDATGRAGTGVGGRGDHAAEVSAGEAYLVYTDRLYSRSDFNNYVAAVYKVLGAFLFGAAVSQSLTDLAKYMIGRLRPNFLAVCDPDWSRINCSVYVQLEKVCRGNPADVTEARLSFYSGHSSFGMYCMLFLALYVQARLCGKWARLLRPTVQFFLVAFALYVGYTRVSDYKHHWSDVLVGLLQGALVAGLTVRYISDFFKARPPQHCPQEEEELERKPSLSLTLTLSEADHNHYGYPHSSS
ncbi:phospholipid phosphatase 2 isoform X1 [Trachypithecus francoisi]|uniref:phospholipid phosphatase 2 isoform X1 n=1 Tax=Trachypithecus francoisi TaxID=54180 RepID=UPI00141ACAA0|nr:phospholipid phosphatase 2 isoform X1 [Trachypithecus francoisi]